MFLDFFGLREQPFGVTPDPRYLYFGASHREALASLYYGIENRRGFVALVAKPGMGKTTLLFRLLERLRGSTHTSFLFQTQLTPREFLRSLMIDLGIGNMGDDIVRMQYQLNQLLYRELRAGRRFVLVVDEAQNLDDSVLETVRMLSNFETPGAKLLQIILSGQPQLADKLASPSLVQLRQRISIFARLPQFTSDEVDKYISHRLKVAGLAQRSIFTPEAIEVISSESQGIPRNINNICFHSMTLGFATGQKIIGAPIVREVLEDLDLNAAAPERNGGGNIDPPPPETGSSSEGQGSYTDRVQVRQEVSERRATPRAAISRTINKARVREIPARSAKWATLVSSIGHKIQAKLLRASVGWRTLRPRLAMSSSLPDVKPE